MLFSWCFDSAGIHFVESLNLQTKMSWSKEFSISGLQWTCRSEGGTSVISGGCYLALSSWMGILLVSRSGVPSGKQCLISILSCFQVFFFFFAYVFEVECPQQNTDALTLVATLVCHDLVYFCSQRVAFMTLYVFCSTCLCFTWTWTCAPPCLTSRREAATAPAPRPRSPQIINCAAVRAAIDEEEVNYRVTGRYSGWRPGWVGLATFLPPSLCVDFFFC